MCASPVFFFFFLFCPHPGAPFLAPFFPIRSRVASTRRVCFLARVFGGPPTPHFSPPGPHFPTRSSQFFPCSVRAPDFLGHSCCAHSESKRRAPIPHPTPSLRSDEAPPATPCQDKSALRERRAPTQRTQMRMLVMSPIATLSMFGCSTSANFGASQTYARTAARMRAGHHQDPARLCGLPQAVFPPAAQECLHGPHHG